MSCLNFVKNHLMRFIGRNEGTMFELEFSVFFGVGRVSAWRKLKRGGEGRENYLPLPHEKRSNQTKSIKREGLDDYLNFLSQT